MAFHKPEQIAELVIGRCSKSKTDIASDAYSRFLGGAFIAIGFYLTFEF